jgi:hypothetical protein
LIFHCLEPDEISLIVCKVGNCRYPKKATGGPARARVWAAASCGCAGAGQQRTAGARLCAPESRASGRGLVHLARQTDNVAIDIDLDQPGVPRPGTKGICPARKDVAAI